MARILVVDDSNTARRIVARLIGGEHELVEADSGAAALSLLEKETFQAILLDLLMPGIDGFEMTRTIRNLYPDLPVIVVSADIQDTTRSRLKALGATEILHKPVKKEELIATIQRVATPS